MKRKSSSRLPSPKSLDSQSTAELCMLYIEVLGRKPPQRASPIFLKGNIAWTIQAIAQNQDVDSLRQSMLNKLNASASSRKPSYKSGSRLIREWHGNTHEVTILEKGFLWQGKYYTSLSRVAQEITGAKWSGPRFFGMTK